MRKLYHHGILITMEQEGHIKEAMLIEEDSIIALGTNEELLALQQPEDQLIDLQGKTMLPGFIDAHSHFVGLANSLSQCDLSEAISFADIVSKMKTFIKEHEIPAGQWVSGNAYDHNFMIEKAHPSKFILDEISTIHPIVIIHASSHMGVANSMALKERHIDADTADPEGGRYYRIAGSREPNGHMEETAFIDFENAMPMISTAQMMKLLVKAQEIYASYGITTIQDGMVANPLFQLLQTASRNELLYLDIVGFIDLNHCRALTKEHKEYVNQYIKHFKIGGYKIFLDGSPQGRTAWMQTPYLGAEDGYSGYPVLSDAHLYTLITQAMEDGLQLLAHCNGDAAAEQYISQFEQVVKEHPHWELHRPVMIHAQLVRKEQLKRMLVMDMIPSFFVAHTYFWGDIHIENFGIERAASISPAKDAQDIGLRYTFHQDSPVLPPDMMRTLWCAVNRKTKSGVPIGPEEAITPYEALQAITIHGAYQYFEEAQKGTLTPGKLADLVILDQNPLSVDPKSIKDIHVVETIKGGQTIYKR